MNEEINWALLARYLSGECSPGEKNKVQSWLDASAENHRLIQHLGIVWDNPEFEYQPSDIKNLWTEVAERAGITAVPEKKTASAEPGLIGKIIGFPLKLHPASYRVLRYAALFAFAVLIPYLYLNIAGDLPWSDEAHSMKSTIVGRQERATLTLTDGSRISLDAGSVLKYPEKFNGNSREVYLYGEGYFEVFSNPQRPFIVHTDDAVIRVLGTKFNVRAWQIDERVVVSVAEGKVSFRPEGGTIYNEVILEKGQQSILPADGLPSKPRLVNIEEQLGWMNNEAVFENVPLREVLFQLSRWYDLEFEFENKSITDERVTLNIQNKSIDAVLKLIAAITDQKYEQDGRTIRFEQKERTLSS